MGYNSGKQVTSEQKQEKMVSKTVTLLHVDSVRKDFQVIQEIESLGTMPG